MTMKRRAGRGRWVRAGLWGALLLGMQGCTVFATPGFGYADAGTRTSVPLGQYVAGDPDDPPRGVITPITEELVQARWMSRPRDVAPEIEALFGMPRPRTIGPSDAIGSVVCDNPDLLPTASAVITQQIDPTGLGSAPGLIVSAGGKVSFPDSGRVKGTGLTEIAASALIETRTTGNTGQIHVILNNVQGDPALFHLDANSPVALALANNFALRSRDVVYIDPVALVRWNRIVSLILPGAQVLHTDRQIGTS